MKFTDAEEAFLVENEMCRLATCHDNIPHVVPVSYVFFRGDVYFATDYETRKVRNLKETNRIALVVDLYSSKQNKAVCIQGISEMVETGDLFQTLYKIFYDKFEWVRTDPWNEGEAPFVRVICTNKVSWGLD